MVTVSTKLQYQHFARLLDYPSAELVQEVDDCTRVMAEISPQVKGAMDGFYRHVKQEPLCRLEELYTRTFDLQGVCAPYVGHHLFGESYKRSWFMARLNEGYRQSGFIPGNELPDHVAVILRYLALGVEDDFTRALKCEGLKPAVETMLAIFAQDGDNPYRHVLDALLLALCEDDRALVSEFRKPER